MKNMIRKTERISMRSRSSTICVEDHHGVVGNAEDGGDKEEQGSKASMRMRNNYVESSDDDVNSRNAQG
jgi:hypothetical protein